MKLFFAITESNEVFDAKIHCREDMRIFKCVISQRETETAVARLLTDSTIPINNDGMAGRADKPLYGIVSFAHESSDDGDDQAHVLMCGKLVHIPRYGSDGLLEWELNAEPDDAAAQIIGIIDTLKTDAAFESGFYDNVGLADVLESRSELMCWDRVTGRLGLSNILVGSKHRVLGDDILGDSLTMKMGPTAVNAVHVTLEANWIQRFCDVINLAPMIATKFSKGIINTLTCDALEKSWPRLGDKIGLGKTRRNTGYTVVKSALRRLPNGVNGLPVTTNPLYMSENGKEPRLMTFTRGWYRGCLWVHYEYKQPCQEIVQFSVLNANPVTGGVVRHLKFKLHDGDGYVENAWASTVFRCSRGLRLLDYAEKVARAHIVGASRQLEVELCVPFKTLWDVDLDTTLQVSHPELPGGQIIGKVLAYQLRVTSDSWLVWVKLGLKAPIDAQKANGDCQQKVPVAAEFVTDYVTDYLERDEGESCGDGAAMAMVQERVNGDIVTNKTYFTQWPLVKVAGEVALDPSTFRLYDLVESIAVKGDGAEQIELLHKAQYPASMHYKEALKGETFQLAVQFMDLSPKQVCQTRWERGLPIVVEV